MLDWHGLRYAPVVPANELRADKARAFATTIAARPELGATLTETREIGDLSAVILEIQVSVGQKPVNNIKKREPILLVFGKADRLWPDVYALRPDFPTHVAHLNAPDPGYPPRLCLSVLPYDEVRRHWTTEFFVGLLRDWLYKTALDALHQPDQPVEQFLPESQRTLIIPHQLAESAFDSSQRWAGLQIAPGIYRVLREEDAPPTHAPLAFMSLIAPGRRHGAVAAPPGNLASLASLVDRDEFRLTDAVQAQVREWIASQRRQYIPVLLLQVPLTRTADGDPERYEIRAFALAATVEELAILLGFLSADNPAGAVIGGTDHNDGSAVELEIWNVQETLSRRMAARYNGETIAELSYVAVGAGALGSQVLNNLTRGGAPPSAVVDKDRFLPHNLARHLLLRNDEGALKAEAVATALSAVLDGGPTVRSVVDDAMTMAPDVFANSDVILDLSASVAVARHLALDIPGPARRVSLFLNPSGSDLVLLAEDAARAVPLDHLEMQYYWRVATDATFAGHFRSEDGERYGGGCRDVSGRIKQTSLAVHAGIGAAAFRRAVLDQGAGAFVWRLDEKTGEVSRIELDALPMRKLEVDGWTVLISSPLLKELAFTRCSKLPNETGGVLIGALDMERRRAYLVGNVPGPRDSVECRTSYVRGFYGLDAMVEKIRAQAGGNLTYIGEWHSHPEGESTEPSRDDRKIHAWVCAAMHDEGRPGIVVIVGDRDVRCILGAAETTLDLAA